MRSDTYADFFVAHHVGDYLLQTDAQARNKARLGEGAVAWRALAAHGLTYTLAFAPSLWRVRCERGVARALCTAALIGVPHVVVDDGRLLHAFMRRVKRADPEANPALTAHVDQSAHLLCLWAAARSADR